MNEKLQEIFRLCLQINNETEYAAFFEIAGHVSKVDVRVCKGKETPLYNEHLYNDYLYYNDEKSGVIKKAHEVIDKLDEFLENS